MSNEIDYSGIAQPPINTTTRWRPPKHVYFGKKLDDGTLEDEPKYEYVEYPRMLYKKVDGKVSAKVVENDTDRDDSLADGWVKNPMECGVITAPSFEEAQAIKANEAKKKK